jgi:hypothetical protein
MRPGPPPYGSSCGILALMADVQPLATDPQAPPDRQALLTVLTTEHFTLQSARGSTVSESSARAALYIGAVSSGLVALGFFSQGSSDSYALHIFTLVLLPTLYALGMFTFVRLVESSIEDIFYGRAISRIRHYYLQLAGAESRYIMLGAHDDPLGVLANMGIARPSRWQLFFTLAAMVAVLNCVLGGCAVALAVSVLGRRWRSRPWSAVWLASPPCSASPAGSATVTRALEPGRRCFGRRPSSNLLRHSAWSDRRPDDRRRVRTEDLTASGLAEENSR